MIRVFSLLILVLILTSTIIHKKNKTEPKDQEALHATSLALSIIGIFITMWYKERIGTVIFVASTALAAASLCDLSTDTEQNISIKQDIDISIVVLHIGYLLYVVAREEWKKFKSKNRLMT